MGGGGGFEKLKRNWLKDSFIFGGRGAARICFKIKRNSSRALIHTIYFEALQFAEDAGIDIVLVRPQ